MADGIILPPSVPHSLTHSLFLSSSQSVMYCSLSSESSDFGLRSSVFGLAYVRRSQEEFKDSKFLPHIRYCEIDIQYEVV